MCIRRRFSFAISLCTRETVKLNKIGCFVVCFCEGFFVFKEIRTLCSICSLHWQQVKI